MSREIEDMYPLHTVPNRLDDGSLFPHTFAGQLLHHAVIELPLPRYRGFRPDPPPPASGARIVAAGLTSAISPSKSTAVDDASSAAWRLQQRLEFIPFEERVKRVSIETTGEPVGSVTGVSSTGSATAAMAGGNDAGGGLSSTTAGPAVTEKYSRVNSSVTSGNGGASHATRVSAGSAAGSGAAKRLPVVLADYLEDKSTIGMVVVDQPGMGMTTALLKFLEWYCKGEEAGGRKVSEREEFMEDVGSSPTQLVVVMPSISFM